jgi:methylthioribose-1-phosphate isomerase
MTQFVKNTLATRRRRFWRLHAGAAAVKGVQHEGIVIRTVEWRNGTVVMIDQRLLPMREVYRVYRDYREVAAAIKDMVVRGAPAIGVAAAYGLVLAAQSSGEAAHLRERGEYLKACRPTAVNLAWAVERQLRLIEKQSQLGHEVVVKRLLAEAHAIRDEDAAMCRAIGRHGAALLPQTGGVLTHCNAGGLATSEYGTALAAIFAAWENGKRFMVYADETRPLLQGARLTCWELQQHGVDATLICDSMAGLLMKQGKVQAAIVGADRIAANGDVANKIGTYSVAVLAKHHCIPFFVAAPSSTFDLSVATGDGIPIEERDPAEVTRPFDRITAPEGIAVYNPAFDVTPASLIAAIVTENGIIRPVTTEGVRAVVGVSQK